MRLERLHWHFPNILHVAYGHNQILAESGRIFKSSTGFGERECGDDVELLELETHCDDLSAERGEVVLVMISRQLSGGDAFSWNSLARQGVTGAYAKHLAP